jgi:hypothetical protein
MESTIDKAKKTTDKWNRKIEEFEKKEAELDVREKRINADRSSIEKRIETRADNIISQKLAKYEAKLKRDYEKRRESLENRQNIALVTYISKSAVIPLFALIFAIAGLIGNKAIIGDAIETVQMLLLPFTWVAGWGAPWIGTMFGYLLFVAVYAGAVAGLVYWVYRFLDRYHENYNDKITQTVFFSLSAVVIFFGNTLCNIGFINVFVMYVVVLLGYTVGRVLHGR